MSRSVLNVTSPSSASERDTLTCAAPLTKVSWLRIASVRYGLVALIDTVRLTDAGVAPGVPVSLVRVLVYIARPYSSTVGASSYLYSAATLIRLSGDTSG